MVLQREGSFLDKAALKLPPTFTSKGLFHDIENDLVAAGGEFIGTVLFLLFGLGASQSVGNILDQYSETKTDTSAAARIICNFYAAAAFGLTLYSTATIFYRFTGSIFNPSISLALLIVGAIKPTRFVLVCIAQMVGGIVANGILFSLSPGPLMVDLKLGSGISATQGCFIEMFTTANLVLSVLMLSAEKHLLTPHAPLAFAFTLFAMMLYSIEYTGTGMNTARAFGTACLSGFPSHHWIYWVGPTLGALLATAFYMLLKSVHYWDINPGQDSTAPLEAHNHQDEEIGRGHLEPATTEEGLERMANRQT